MTRNNVCRGGLLLALLLTATACAASDSTPAATTATAQESAPASSATSTTTGDSVTVTTADGTVETTPPSTPSSCPAGDNQTPWDSTDLVSATVVQEQGGGTPGVSYVSYAHPDYEGRPWSHWGQGIVTSSGTFLSAIGDHLGADGNAYIYEFDPETGTQTRIMDVLSTVSHQAGDWGYGKVHAQMVEGACGEIYVSTYWGSRRNLTFTDGYQGDILFRLDPVARTSEEIGVILPEHGVASMAISPDGTLIYAEAADPFGEKTGSFVVLDAATGDLLFENDDPSHGGYRSIAVDASGAAYITWNDDGLARYDPTTNTLEETDVQLPGSILRAVTAPDDNGRMIAVSRDPAIFFAIESDLSIQELGSADGYTTSIAASPDGGTVYYIPDAHGKAWENGTPLMALDTTTGESSVVVELNPLLEPATGLRTEAPTAWSSTRPEAEYSSR